METLPFQILEQNHLKLPLTDNQRARVIRLKEKYDSDKYKANVISRFNKEQQALFQTLSFRDQSELIDEFFKDKINDFQLREGFHHPVIEKFLSVGLPLLDRYVRQIQEYNRKQSRERPKPILNSNIHVPIPRATRVTAVDGNLKHNVNQVDYKKLIHRHLETLRQVRSKEEKLSVGMKREWDRIQEMIRVAKADEEIDYSSFKLNLTMICYALQVKLDEFL